MLPIIAAYRHPEELTKLVEQNPPRVTRDTVRGRVVVERHSVHIPDLMADPEYHYAVTSLGLRTVLGVPLLREGAPVGVISSSRLRSNRLPTNRSISSPPSLIRR